MLCPLAYGHTAILHVRGQPKTQQLDPRNLDEIASLRTKAHSTSGAHGVHTDDELAAAGR